MSEDVFYSYEPVTAYRVFRVKMDHDSYVRARDLLDRISLRAYQLELIDRRSWRVPLLTPYLRKKFDREHRSLVKTFNSFEARFDPALWPMFWDTQNEGMQPGVEYKATLCRQVFGGTRPMRDFDVQLRDDEFRECACGFHAWKTYDLAYRYLHDYTPLVSSTRYNFIERLVLASVELSGTVVEHERGYRASTIKARDWLYYADISKSEIVNQRQGDLSWQTLADPNA